ncbi:hypothetical protein HHI36_010799 [Cryptolaemus montrouzieri]|uniref:Uncharacterized protein n=1 Tax=Cryptolaemus montrouzieri TaxID=559131 RepID=A0ABD2MKI5_9CUCU
MQKILIIPEMMTKNSFFISRLICFNETFASLRNHGQNVCVLWHEAIMGRNSSDVVCAYYNFMKFLGENVKNIVLWADNCAAQNKNWTLFIACSILVDEEWGPETITFKIFEAGHSFMKADSVHGLIGKK